MSSVISRRVIAVSERPRSSRHLEKKFRFQENLVKVLALITRLLQFLQLKQKNVLNSVEITNKMQPCNRIYYSTVH